MTDVTIIPSVTDVTIVPTVTVPILRPSTTSSTIVPSLTDVIVSPSVTDAVIYPIFGEPGPAGPAGPAGTGGVTGYYGAFSDYTSQTALANTATVMTFNTVDAANGFSVVSSSRLTCANTATYNFQWSGQFENTGVANDDIDVWIRLNGADVVGSTGRVSIPSKHGSNIPGHALVGWNFILNLTAGDYIQLVWATAAATTGIVTYASGVSPTHPSTASLIATFQQVTNTVAAAPTSGYNHTQASVSTTWTINHNLGYKPNVQPFNSGSVAVIGEILHTSVNQTVITFNTAIAGFARLS